MHAHPARLASVTLAPVAPGRDSGTDELLRAFGPERRLTRHQYLYHEGDPCTGIYLIETGAIKVSALSTAGDEQIVGFYLPGEILALESPGESRHSSSAMALEPTRLRALSLPALEALCLRSPAAHRRLLHLVSRRIAEMQEHLLLLGRRSAPERLAGFLADLAARTRTRDITLSMSRGAIGSYLGIALETVSRLLHQFQDQQLIALKGRRVSLFDPGTLYRMAQGEYARAA